MGKSEKFGVDLKITDNGQYWIIPSDKVTLLWPIGVKKNTKKLKIQEFSRVTKTSTKFYTYNVNVNLSEVWPIILLIEKRRLTTPKVDITIQNATRITLGNYIKFNFYNLCKNVGGMVMGKRTYQNYAVTWKGILFLFHFLFCRNSKYSSSNFLLNQLKNWYYNRDCCVGANLLQSLIKKNFSSKKSKSKLTAFRKVTRDLT